MSDVPFFNILMYSHDTYGLGHIRRTMAIAANLLRDHINILILTGSPMVGRFTFPKSVDFVRIPGMIKMTNEEYLPLSIKIDPKQALDIRTNIITATARTFCPDLFIVDKEPHGLKKEVLPTLIWLNEKLPTCRCILGLRDIMDSANVIREDWASKEVYQTLEHLYDEIWVYGNKDLYDPALEYGMGENIAGKIHYTGYIPRKIAGKEAVKKVREEFSIRPDEKLVLVTTGGGGDGFAIMDHYLSMLESENNLSDFRSILITGPFMPKSLRNRIHKRCKKLGVKVLRFYRDMETLIGAADLVVTMGGYNTICEVLSQKKVSLVVPRETPRMEQRIRAEAMGKRNLVDFIPWSGCTPALLRVKIEKLLFHPRPYVQAVSKFKLTGLQVIQNRIRAHQNKTL